MSLFTKNAGWIEIEEQKRLGEECHEISKQIKLGTAKVVGSLVAILPTSCVCTIKNAELSMLSAKVCLWFYPWHGGLDIQNQQQTG